MTVASILRAAMRARNDMSGIDLARRADLTPKHVSRLLHGHERLSVEVAIRLGYPLGERAVRAALRAQLDEDLRRARAAWRVKRP